MNKENADGLNTEDFHYAISRAPDFARFVYKLCTLYVRRYLDGEYIQLLYSVFLSFSTVLSVSEYKLGHLFLSDIIIHGFISIIILQEVLIAHA